MLDFGISSDEFFEQCFERQPRLWRAALKGEATSWRDLDQTLQVIEPNEKSLQLFMENAQPLPLSNFASEREEMGRIRAEIDKHRFFSLLHRGATLVLNRLETCSLLARRLCDEVARFTHTQTSCNSYITWTGHGAFGKHWDTHDVFVVQLIGRKHWRVFPPTLPLPLSHQTSKSSGMTTPITATLDCELQAGDVLYIPRGWWHDVTPLNTGSWHMSVGAYTHTVSDYITWLCHQVLPTQEDARRGVYKTPSDSQLESLIQKLRQAALDPESFRAFTQSNNERNQPHVEFNTTLFMAGAALGTTTDAIEVDAANIVVSRSTPHRIPLDRGEVTAPTGTLRLDTLKRALIEILNRSNQLTVAQLMERLPAYSPALIRDALRQLGVLEVISMRQQTVPPRTT